MLLNNILDILHKYRRKNWIFLRMPPVRGRELKPCEQYENAGECQDAPCAGARIETRRSVSIAANPSRCPLCGGEN